MTITIKKPGPFKGYSIKITQLLNEIIRINFVFLLRQRWPVPSSGKWLGIGGDDDDLLRHPSVEMCRQSLYWINSISVSSFLGLDC